MSQALVTGRDALVEKLRSRDCRHCSDGTLVEGTYKDNDAVLCDECETPALQLW
ncbi:HVO_A0556 family zinc finger protein [Halogranum rubrum]|uniref:Small CPxCG-related zinc finger protein n=1 Tax=Halogranum salarium B-1 TaxID=1210908 RepID=J3JE79_9EURY|nr:HVO_A0556 family zinc finger protein [Halogranum salarium]EJN58131.1 hypothetical protein HSB1_35480 [Halogranum salarium B-1]